MVGEGLGRSNWDSDRVKSTPLKSGTLSKLEKILNGQWTKVSAIFNRFFQEKEGKIPKESLKSMTDKEAKILPVTTYLWWSMYSI